MKKEKRVWYLLLLSVLILSACGGNTAGDGSLSEEETVSPGAASAAAADVMREDEEEDAGLNSHDSIGRIDYPLLDIYFEEDKTYRLALVDYAPPNKVCKEYEDKGRFFQFNKEYFSIITLPSGRGTTPEYILEVYEGEKCIRQLDCVCVRPGVLDEKW